VFSPDSIIFFVLCQPPSGRIFHVGHFNEANSEKSPPRSSGGLTRFAFILVFTILRPFLSSTNKQ